jgi:hypothetical protein
MLRRLQPIGEIMSERSYLRNCPSCGGDFAKTVNECPHCGKKLQSGLMLKLIIGLGCLALAGAFAIPTSSEQSEGRQHILNTAVDHLNSTDLVEIFNQNPASINHQAQNTANQIKGKIIQWELEVFVVTKSQNYYKIVTKPTSNAPGTLLTVYPKNDRQIRRLDTIRTGTTIEIKGKITGIQQGRIKINPAVLI